MFDSNNLHCHTISYWDLILLPIFLTIILLISRIIKRKRIARNDEYRFFVSGLFYKIIGGIAFYLIYVYYYGWGDTVSYYYGSIDLCDMFWQKSSVFFSVLNGNLSLENLSYFHNTGYWSYMYKDPNSYAVIRFTLLLSYFGFKSYLLMTILLAGLSFIGIWKLFTVFYQEFKEIKKQLAFAILFIPSVAFWGSGILKDTYTLAATCILFYCSYYLLLKKKKITQNIIGIIISSYILISIRPYMFYISFDSLIVMLSYGYLSKIKTAFMKFLALISIIIVLWGGGISLFLYIGNNVNSAYSIDNLLQKAVITQEDLKREEYGGNSFDIGKIEPTLPGIISKAPLAINAGLFYPYIWKAKNPVMLISGMENLILLLLTLYVVLLVIIATFRNGVKYMLKTTFDHPFIIYSIVYSLQYSFMVGLTTANYGALVRYKIPLIPFYLATLFIIIYKFNKEQTMTIEKEP